MPLPLIIGGIAAIAGAAGVGSGIHGGVKMKEANDTMKLAQRKQERAVALFEKRNTETTELMDTIGKQELSILSSFDDFSNIIEKIQGRPDFKAYKKDGINLPDYEAEELKKVSAGAGILLGGIGGAATNATLALLGGGTLAAGGGGMALGTAVLGGATLGIGLLVGGIVFNATGSKLSDKADEAYSQASRTEKEVNKIVGYFDELSSVGEKFKASLSQIEEQYRKRLATLDHVVNFSEKTEWSSFTEKEKQMTENAVLLAGLLYKMCKVSLVLKAENDNELNKVNKDEINKVTSDADKVFVEVKDAA